MSLRNQTLRIASNLPKGDPTRRELLAAIAGDKTASVAKDLAKGWAPILKKIPLDVRQKAKDIEDLESHRGMEKALYESKAYQKAFDALPDQDNPDEMSGFIADAWKELLRMGIVGRKAK